MIVIGSVRTIATDEVHDVEVNAPTYVAGAAQIRSGLADGERLEHLRVRDSSAPSAS